MTLFINRNALIILFQSFILRSKVLISSTLLCTAVLPKCKGAGQVTHRWRVTSLPAFLALSIAQEENRIETAVKYAIKMLSAAGFRIKNAISILGKTKSACSSSLERKVHAKGATTENVH